MGICSNCVYEKTCGEKGRKKPCQGYVKKTKTKSIQVTEIYKKQMNMKKTGGV